MRPKFKSKRVEQNHQKKHRKRLQNRKEKRFNILKRKTWIKQRISQIEKEQK